MKKNSQRNAAPIIKTNRLNKQRRLSHGKSSNHQHIAHRRPANPQNWYQLRKRAQQILNTIYKDARILSSMYRGHDVRHYIQGPCEHIFKLSLEELVHLGDKSCPFCNEPLDMDHYGNIEAIQEHINKLSHGNVHFIESNELGRPEHVYEFMCLIHRFRFWAPYQDFIQNPEYACPMCAFETWR